MARVLAFVAAVVMVVGAIAVRHRIDNPPDGGTSSDAPLVCASELRPVCETLQRVDGVTITVEPAGVTAARLSSATTAAGVGGWLVPQPWPRLVDDGRRRAGLDPLFESDGKVIARSPLVLVGWRDRLAALGAFCRGTVGYRCVGDAAEKGSWDKAGGRAEWGPVKPFHADPTAEASGLLAVAAETVAFTGRTDVSSADLDDDAYAAWLTATAKAIPTGLPETSSAAVQDLLTKGPAAFDTVITIEAEAAPAVAASARRSQLDVLYPSPVVTADVVLARPTGGNARLRGAVTGSEARKVFASFGWRVGGFVPVAGVRNEPLPSTDGLPADGLLVALQSRWREVSR